MRDAKSSDTRLRRGDLLPLVRVPPPGPRSLAACRDLGALEAPGINTLYGGAPSILWSEARGANVLDVDGNRYIDMTSGFCVAAIGHRHPRVVAAVRRQSARLLHGLGDVAGHEPRIELARRLCALAPVDDAQVYFAISGSDAVEIAIKTAILKTGKPGLLVFDPAYHGLTLGALAASSRRLFRQPFELHLQPFVERLPFGVASERIADLLALKPEIGCVLVEPIVGREGVLVPPDGWLGALAAVCARAGVLLAVDEILTGLWRTGPRFAVDAERVRPDLLCCGKALAGGVPIAAVVGRRAVMTAWGCAGEARHTATFVAHPLACAAALACLDVLESESFQRSAIGTATRLEARLSTWKARFQGLQQIRGRGCFWGLELSSSEQANKLALQARQEGILLLTGGCNGRVAQLAPPLDIAPRQLDKALDILEHQLTLLETT